MRNLSRIAKNAERFLVDAGKVTRLGDPVWDGTQTSQSETVVGETKCLVARPGDSAVPEVFGDVDVETSRIFLPRSFTDCVPGDRIEIIEAHHDPALEGTVWQIETMEHRTYQIIRRYTAKLLQRTVRA